MALTLDLKNFKKGAPLPSLAKVKALFEAVVAHADKTDEVPVGAIVRPTLDNNTPFFVADRAYKVKSVVGRVHTAEGSARTAVLRKAPAGTGISAGTALHSGSLNLNGTAHANQSLTLSTTAADLLLAAGDALGWNCDGGVTTAVAGTTVILEAV